MAANSIIPPYPTFFEADGSPLENGYIYVGQPGFEAQSSPKASFFDLAMTIPTGTASGAAVRTLAGFPVQNGAAVMIYVDGDFSVTVKDRNGVLIYSALNRTFAFAAADITGQPVQAPDGNFAAAGFGFINEVNTGFVRQGVGVMQSIVLGNVVWQQSPTGTSFLLPVSGAGFVSGVATALNGIGNIEGDTLYRGNAGWARLPKGTAGQVLRQNDLATPNIAPAWTDPLKSSVATALSGLSNFDWTGIPAWARRITVDLASASMSGTDIPLIQLGTAAGFVTTGYISGAMARDAGGTMSHINSTAGFAIQWNVQPDLGSSSLVLTRVGDSQTWVGTVDGVRVNAGIYNGIITGGGRVTLPDVITQVRLTRSGTDTFDAGLASIMWE